jgi:hypothetical protein
MAFSKLRWFTCVQITPTKASVAAGCYCCHRRLLLLHAQPGMEAAAAVLKTRRVAALKGATTEWEKLEGVTYDPRRNG